MNTNPLTDILPAAYRRYMYAIYTAAVIAVGALAVAGVSTGKAADVLAYLGGALALTAASNTNAGSDDVDPGVGGADRSDFEY
ncbi:hypothetical protein [Nocardioides sp. HB32]